MSYSHSKNDVDDTLLKLRDVCDSIMKNIQNDNFDEHVKGTIPKPIWAMKIPPTKKL